MVQKLTRRTVIGGLAAIPAAVATQEVRNMLQQQTPQQAALLGQIGQLPQADQQAVMNLVDVLTRCQGNDETARTFRHLAHVCASALVEGEANARAGEAQA